MDAKIIIHPSTILIVNISWKIITDKIVPNRDSVDKISAERVCSTFDWQIVCSKNATAVEKIPRYNAPIIPRVVAWICVCLVAICNINERKNATTN